MRILLVALALSASSLIAQDPGMIANQQASQAALDASNSNQQIPPPRFSLKSGTYPGKVTLTIKTPLGVGRAPIFYTIGDWTPTASSIQYTGPIEIDRTETISAITIVRGWGPSLVRHATYTLPASVAPATSSASSLMLPAGTPVVLQFAADFDSSKAAVGQTVPFVLSQDLVLNGHLIATRGTPAQGTLTEVKTARRFERPGRLAFRVDQLQLPGRTIALSGAEIKDGPPLGVKQNVGLLVPVAGALTFLQHGSEAQIPAGAELNASIATTTSLDAAPVTP